MKYIPSLDPLWFGDTITLTVETIRKPVFKSNRESDPRDDGINKENTENVTGGIITIDGHL